jgi:ADP-heptose:LPS heptosyltransferase
MVCSDSFALHISLAMAKPTVGLFFCTSADEVEGYGLLRKIVSPMQKEFFPERMDEYSEELTKSITAEEVLKNIQ